MDILEKTLPNGIKYLGIHMPDAQSARIVMCMKRGALHDITPGTSHFLEHVLFHHAPNSPQERTVKILDRYGISTNATTSWSHTQFEIPHPPDLLKTAIDAAFHLISNENIEPGKVELERKVILTEAKMYLDDTYYVLNEELLQNLFRNPNTWRIGSLRNIKDMKIAYLQDAFLDYASENCIAAYIGPKDHKDVIKHISKIELPQKTRIVDSQPLRKLYRQSEKRDHVSIPHLMWGFHTPPAYSLDLLACNIATAFLSQGDFSFLFEEFRTKRGWSYSLDTDYECGVRHSYISFSTELSKVKNIKQAHELVRKGLSLAANLTRKEFTSMREKYMGTELREDLNLEDTLNAAISRNITGNPAISATQNADLIRSVTYDRYKRVMSQIYANPIASAAILPK